MTSQKKQHLNLTLRGKYGCPALWVMREERGLGGEFPAEATNWKEGLCREAERTRLVVSIEKSPGGFLFHQLMTTPGAIASERKRRAGICLREPGGHLQILKEKLWLPSGTASWTAFAFYPPTSSDQGLHIYGVSNQVHHPLLPISLLLCV